MAVMIPNCGPAPTESRAEQLIYPLLRDQLDDSYTVVHSLPWLSAAVAEIAGAKAITGEIDFLIVHPELGVLAIEVKGGSHRVQGLAFVHIQSGNKTRALEQVRTSTHGLAKWLGVSPALRLKIGYALVFPDSDFRGQVISTALNDVSVDPPESIVVDRPQVPRIGQRLTQIMSYWKASLSNPALGQARRDELINMLCPAFDGTPSWGARVAWDEKVWLRLTAEQSAVVDQVNNGGRQVITGWPGTGKTLILIESARRLLREGKTVLILTYNALLARFIQAQLGSHKTLTVGTWHGFCRSVGAAKEEKPDPGWLELGCLKDARRAASTGKLQPFDALLLDEAQTFRREWVEWLFQWLVAGPQLVFCDETQVFTFERSRVTLSQLCELTGVKRPFALTTVLRSPRAVYQRLMSVRVSDYQLHMPRGMEPDTLKEVLVVGVGKAISQMLQTLADSGVPDQDIVLLDKYGQLTNDGSASAIRSYALSSFRGMEAPVIIICGAEQMDDAELFCAYSRATTLCIALYDAEVMGARGADCEFHDRILSEPEHSKAADSARMGAQTHEIIRANASPTWLDLESIEIGWLKEWDAWVVVERNVLSRYWIDYLAWAYPWPVYFWSMGSLREIHSALPLESAVEKALEVQSYKIYLCEDCAVITPQSKDPHGRGNVWECRVCARRAIRSPEVPDPSVVDPLRAIDMLLMRPTPLDVGKEERKSLPLFLAAGAALLFATGDTTRERVMPNSSTSGRITYHAALAFVYSLINLLTPGKRIDVNTMAQELFDRYQIPSELEFSAWKGDFAQACNTAYGRGHLNKIDKGVYATVGGVDA